MKRVKKRNLSEIHRESTQYLVEWDSKTGHSTRKQVAKETKTTGVKKELSYGKGNSGGNESAVNVETANGTEDQSTEGVQVGLGAEPSNNPKARVQRAPRAVGKRLHESAESKESLKPKGKSLKSKSKPLIPEWKPKPVTKRKRKKSKKLKSC